MTRWIMIGITVFGLVMAILTRSPGLLGLGLGMVFVGLFGMVFSLAGERISANARPDATMLSADVLKAVRDNSRAKSAVDTTVRAPAQVTRDIEPGRPTSDTTG